MKEKEENEIKINSNDSYKEENILKTNLPREKRRIIRKKLSYIEPLEQPGTIYNAEVHGSAQRLLKVHRLTSYVKFCKCCCLPQETPGVVVPFNLSDKQLDFGLGIYLYFYYIKLCLIISIICIGLASVSTIIVSQDYSLELNNYCDLVFNESRLRNLDVNDDFKKACTKFSSTSEGNETDKEIYSNIIQIDWLISMSAHNVKNYYDVFKYNITQENKEDKIVEITLDYSFMYFLTGLTILIADYFFILNLNLLDECQNFEETTPRDYTILIHGVSKPEGNNDDMKEEVINLIREVSYYKYPLQIYQIIPCLRIAEIYKIAKEKYNEETKIYHIYNLEKQKILNKEYGYNKNNLHYFEEIFCIKKKKPIREIQKKINELQNKLNNLLRDLNDNPNKYNGGTFLVVFSTMKMKDNFYDFFPHSYGSKIFWSIRYFFECILFSFCVSQERKSKTKLKLSVDVSQATEPYEILWENMGHTRFEINCYKLISFVCTIVLIIISLGIIIGLNTLQYKVSQNNFTGNTFVKYLLSLFISIVLAVSNIIGEIVLQKLSIMEKIEYKTSFYITFSIKLTIYTFIIIGILPLVANYINGDWGNNDLLVNNMLMIFITNIVLPPAFFYLSPGLIIKMYKRIKAKLDLNNVKLENSNYTQAELNEIFENPIMNISYKYCYVTNVFLVSLFYLSIFPIGMIFGFLGLLFTYISEFFYIGLYKRPEILNSKLCYAYVSNFKWVVFVFVLGNYIFIGWLSETKPINWSLINLIIFLILCLIPYQHIKINFLGISESDSKNDTYEQNSIYFSTDYEKLCPFTRKEGFLRYFKVLLDEKIIDKKECNRIINNLQNINMMDSYLKTSRHIDDFCAVQQLNNLYIRNKNNKKEEDIMKNELGIEKDNINDIKSINLDENKIFFEKIKKLKEYLYSFSSTAAGVSNALILLGEKNNEENNNKGHFNNYNPWKADWIFSKDYLKKRKNLINEIRDNIDFRGEISDDEDTIINYDESINENNENKINELEEDIKSINNINENDIDKKDIKENKNIPEPFILDNKQIITGEIRIDNKEDKISEKSESIKFNNMDNKFYNNEDKNTSNNFIDRPSIFNHTDNQKNVSDRSLFGLKNNSKKNDNNNMNHSLLSIKNKSNIIENLSEDENK